MATSKTPSIPSAADLRKHAIDHADEVATTTAAKRAEESARRAALIKREVPKVIKIMRTLLLEKVAEADANNLRSATLAASVGEPIRYGHREFGPLSKFERLSIEDAWDKVSVEFGVKGFNRSFYRKVPKWSGWVQYAFTVSW